MCTRFYYDNSIPKLEEYCQLAKEAPLMERFVTYLCKPLLVNAEVRPTDVVPVIAPDKAGNQAVFPMLWGFTIELPKTSTMGNRGNLIVNARIETAGEKKSFKESWEKHRCIIPCAYYFEWNHVLNSSTGKMVPKEKYMIQPKDTEITYLAELYRIENSYPVFTILTKEPTERLSEIHDRMPVVFPEELVKDWIDPSSDPSSFLDKCLEDMVLEVV